MFFLNRKVTFTMGLMGGCVVAVYPAAFGFEDILAAWLILGFPYCFSEYGESELEAPACAPKGTSGPSL